MLRSEEVRKDVYKRQVLIWQREQPRCMTA